MNRDQRLVLIALPVIAFSGWLVRKEYREYVVNSTGSAAPSAAQNAFAPTVAAPPVKSNVAKATVPRGIAVEEVAKNATPEDTLTIERAKSAKASSLDGSLPRESLSEWMRETAGGSARIMWRTSGCGDVGSQEGVVPVCAEADIDFSDGTKFQTLLLLGSRDAKSQSVNYGDPSLLGSVYARRGSDTLMPAPLSSLSRIAAAAE